MFERFQNKANNITGPKVEPKPAQAKETIWNTELSGFDAKNMATIAIPITVHLATITFAFSDNLIHKTPSIKFSVTLDEAARSCESEVDIVDAKIPARITPAIIANKIPCELKTFAI